MLELANMSSTLMRKRKMMTSTALEELQIWPFASSVRSWRQIFTCFSSNSALIGIRQFKYNLHLICLSLYMDRLTLQKAKISVGGKKFSLLAAHCSLKPNALALLPTCQTSSPDIHVKVFGHARLFTPLYPVTFYILSMPICPSMSLNFHPVSFALVFRSTAKDLHDPARSHKANIYPICSRT